MKEYVVKTMSANNEMLLHSTMKKEFVSEDFNAAKKAFEKEVETLKNTYCSIEDLEYCPSDREMGNAIFCELITIDEEGDIESIETSDYYFEK